MNLDGTVADIMTTQVLTLWEEDNLQQISDRMEKWRLRHLPVVDDRKLVGLVSHRDTLRWAASALDSSRVAQSRESSMKENTFVADVMVRDVETVSPDTAISEAARRLVTSKYACLPVTDQQGNLVGIVSEHDFVKLLVTDTSKEEREP